MLGAQFEVFVEDNDQETDFLGWKVESMDPKVLQLRAEPYKMSPHILVVEVGAIGEGVTELLLKDTSGAIRGSAAVEVKRPTAPSCSPRRSTRSTTPTSAARPRTRGSSPAVPRPSPSSTCTKTSACRARPTSRCPPARRSTPPSVTPSWSTTATGCK
ncbi:hypothetical protein [Nannocystis pusilla]|uniref:hypothetical protein n=1 Tax=Nannocystis pusilla TaxID=889268 RepID=UPI003B790AEE